MKGFLAGFLVGRHLEKRSQKKQESEREEQARSAREAEQKEIAEQTKAKEQREHLRKEEERSRPLTVSEILKVEKMYGKSYWTNPEYLEAQSRYGNRFWLDPRFLKAQEEAEKQRQAEEERQAKRQRQAIQRRQDEKELAAAKKRSQQSTKEMKHAWGELGTDLKSQWTKRPKYPLLFACTCVAVVILWGVIILASCS